jgi:hypothetical protein
MPCPSCNVPDDDGETPRMPEGFKIEADKKVGTIDAQGMAAPLNDPNPLPDGRELVTLEEAGNYITKLPKAEHEAPVMTFTWKGYGDPRCGCRIRCSFERASYFRAPDFARLALSPQGSQALRGRSSRGTTT